MEQLHQRNSPSMAQYVEHGTHVSPSKFPLSHRSNQERLVIDFRVLDTNKLTGTIPEWPDMKNLTLL